MISCSFLYEITLIYQVPAWLWNSADIHWLPVNGIDKASFWDSDGTDDMDPPGWRESAVTILQTQDLMY